MGIDPKDNDVFELLKKLKETNGAYPPELLTVRRQGYLKRVAEVSGGVGLAVALKNTVQTSKGAALPPAAGTLLETLLVVAIVAEVGAAAYFYRAKLAELFQNISRLPKVEEISNPPVVLSPILGLELTLSPVATETVTESVTPISTPSLLAEQQPTDKSGGGSEGGSQAVSTPNAGETGGNNGNQYGLTPKPERTKEPGNNSTNNPDSQSDPKKKK